MAASVAVGLFAALPITSCGGGREPGENADVVENATNTMAESPRVSGTGAEGTAEGAPVVLEPDEYLLWEGDWYEASSGSVEDNVYFRLEVFGAGQHGFGYRLEQRDVPYGPNAVWSQEQTARFDGPLRATGHAFSLSVDPADRHARVIDVAGGDAEALGWSVPDWGVTAKGRFVFEKSVYRPGFDCDAAATPVETAICGNELLAPGDFEMNTLYGELIEGGGPELERSLRASQRRFLVQRDGECQEKAGRAAEARVGRRHADRLAALGRLREPSLGDGPRFDADFAKALLQAGTDLRTTTEAQRAMYPLEMRVGENGERVDWQCDDSGVLFEQTYVDTNAWPADVEIATPRCSSSDPAARCGRRPT